VFKLDSSGNESILHFFTMSNGDGFWPTAGLVIDPSGNLYGTTLAGGATLSGRAPGNDGGTVFELDSSGNERILYGFTGSDGAQPVAGLLIDALGNLYGTTLAGGSSYSSGVEGYGTVFKLKTPTTSTVTSSVSPAIVGASIGFTATVTSPFGIPTGTVAFYDGTNSLGPGTLDASGQATFSTSSFSVGTHSITAAYGGDSHFADSASSALAQNVEYGICALYDQTRSVKRGAVFPIKIQLCAASGTDLSSSAIAVHAGSITAASGSSGTPESPGNSNADGDFRFDASLGPTGGYIFNLSTSGLSTGTYSLQFTAGSDPTTHSVQFGVK
jgi:hypothetical protein